MKNGYVASVEDCRLKLEYDLYYIQNMSPRLDLRVIAKTIAMMWWADTMVGKSTSHWPISITNGAAAVLNIFLPIALVRILTLDQMGRYKVFFLYVALSPGLFLVSGLSNGIYSITGRENIPTVNSKSVRAGRCFMAACRWPCAAFGLALTPWIAPAIHLSRED